MSFTPDLFSPFPADNLDLLDGDMAWVFEKDADPAQTAMEFSDFGFADIDITADMPDLQSLHPRDSRMHTVPNADLVAGLDLAAGDQPSNGSSSISQSTSVSTASASASVSSSSPSPCFPIAVVAQPLTGQGQVVVDPCTSQRSETCLAAALRTLTTLHIAQSTCLSAHREAATTAQQARQTETVLSTNKDVVAAMGSILACSCSAKSQVQLLLLSICGHLVAWNGAVISADVERGDGAFSGGARVLPQSISIGQYQIDGKLGRALHGQVMAGELRLLERLVDALSQRLCEASSPIGGPSTPLATHTTLYTGNVNVLSLPSKGMGLANPVHRRIISSLHTRLEMTRAKIWSLS